MCHFIDQQGASARPRPPLTWRHKAPTGAPACTPVHVGEEGTTSARAFAPSIASATACACQFPARCTPMEA